MSGVSPASGPAAGGTSVTITGTLFSGATEVDFGSTKASKFVINSATQITATSPAGTGLVDVTVTTPEGVSPMDRPADAFSYAPVVTGISPAQGPLAGGASVTIAGTNLLNAKSVTFGTGATAVTVTKLTSDTATKIVVKSPKGTAGTVDVTVTAAGGTSLTLPADQFTYVAVPSVLSISPVSGAQVGGTRITITGTNLLDAAAVKFGTTAATKFIGDTATQIVLDSPLSKSGHGQRDGHHGGRRLGYLFPR